MQNGAIGELNMVEAWWDRNSATERGSIPFRPTPRPRTSIGTASSAAPRRFRSSPCVSSAGAIIATMAPASPAICSSTSSPACISSPAPSDPSASTLPAACVLERRPRRARRDARLVRLSGDGKHPAFNLALRVNFVDGGSETSGFRFVGSEGILTIDGVTVSKQPRETEPGYTIDTFPKAVQEKYLKDYREKYPKRAPPPMPSAPSGRKISPALRLQRPPGSSPQFPRSRAHPQARGGGRGIRFRAAGPALLSNISYFEKRVCAWDPTAWPEYKARYQ